MGEHWVHLDGESKLVLDSNETPKLVEALKTQDPKQQKAVDNALSLVGLATSYFTTAADPGTAVAAGQYRLRYENKVAESLADPEEGMRTALVIQTLQDRKAGGGFEYGNWDISHDVPNASFVMTDEKTVKEICFGYPQTRHLPPENLCASIAKK